MAKGRTISANFLTDLDKKVLEFCGKISQEIFDALPNKDAKKHFKDTFGKISKTTRDAGSGLGGGKLQRDALCTRGISGSAPFSNRNLRWHPLVAAETLNEQTVEDLVPFAKPIERIEIEGEDDAQTFVFIIKNKNNEKLAFPSDRVYLLPERFIVLPEHWSPHIEKLKFWKEPLWTQNSCIITAYEACNWQDAVEAYAILGISVAVNFYDVNFDEIYQKVVAVLLSNTESKFPSPLFPSEREEVVNCPLCKVATSKNPANFKDRSRDKRWKPAWSGNKRGEGEDSSMQIMHVEPLIEIEMRHNAKNVRFGHRWCNVAMTDHSIDETVDFMEYIVKAHNRV